MAGHLILQPLQVVVVDVDVDELEARRQLVWQVPAVARSERRPIRPAHLIPQPSLQLQAYLAACPAYTNEKQRVVYLHGRLHPDRVLCLVSLAGFGPSGPVGDRLASLYRSDFLWGPAPPTGR